MDVCVQWALVQNFSFSGLDAYECFTLGIFHNRLLKDMVKEISTQDLIVGPF